MPFSGVITAIITPFEQNGDIDFKAFERLLISQKKSGINGVVVLGTTGENATLTDQESENLVKSALEHQSEDFHIYVGTGTNDTRTSIEKSIKFSNLKSHSGKSPNGVMVVTPYYNKPSQSCLIKHYSEVAKSVRSTPFCIYNVPSRTGINLLPITLAKITQENENIVAIKEAAGNVNAIVEMRNALNQINKQQVRILSGDDATYVPALLCGAEGVISVTSHIIPKTLIQILEMFKKGEMKEVQKLHLATYCINNGVFALPNPIGVKWMLSHLGICGTTLRAPLYSAEGNEVDILKGIFAQLQQNNIQF